MIAGPHEEAVVHRTDFGRSVVFVLQQVLSQCLGHGVGHFHEGRDAPRGSRGGFCGDLRFVGESWLTEMHLVIDATGHQPKAGAVFHFRVLGQRFQVGVFREFGQFVPHSHNVLTIDQHVLGAHKPVVHHVGILKQGGLAHGQSWVLAGKKMRLKRICRTPSSASRKVFMLILDVPS